MANRRPFASLVAPAALVLWVAFFLWPALAPGRALLGVDLLYRFPPWDALVAEDWEASNHLLFDQAAQFYPWRLEARRLAAAGLPPLWNRSAGAGSPLLANQQSATLAPVELAVSWLDPARAPAVAAAIRLLIAGLGMVALARALGAGPAAALFAALAFLGSGSIALLLYHPNSNVSMWLPLVALLSARLAGGARPRTAALLALVLGAELVGGHPETSLYLSLASLLAFALGRALGSRAALSRGVALLAAAHLLGAGLAAPQILPFLEYLREGAVLSHRSGERFWNPPACAVGLLVPELFGTPERPNTYFGPRNYHAVATQYAGLPTAVLAAAAVAAALFARGGRGDPRRRGLVLGLAAIAATALLLVYPTPLWRLAGTLPPFRVAANVTGLTLLAVAALALLGALGLEALGPAEHARLGLGPRPRRLLALAVAAAGLAALLAGLLLPLARDRLLAAGAERLAERYAGVVHARPLAYYMERLPLVVAVLRATLLRTGALALAVAIFLGPGARFGPGPRALAFLALLALDLAHFGRGYVPAIPVAQVFPLTPEIEALARAPGAPRVLPTGRALPPNTLTAYGIEDFRLHDAVGSAARERFEAAMTREPFLRRPLASHDRALLDVAGVDLVVLERGEAVPDSAGFTVLEQGAVTVARNDRAWPRVFFCAMAQETETDSAAIEAARAIDGARSGNIPPSAISLTPARCGRAVAGPGLWSIVRALWPGVDRPPPPLLRREVPVVADAGGTAVEIGRATLAPLAATAALTAPGPGWVVLLDADFPGWEVTVDGGPARAARAYGLFRAVAVPAGAHTIAWRYRPASYALGLLCAAPALALAGLGIGLGGRPRGGFSGRTRR